MWWLALVAGCGDAVQDAYDRDGDGYVAVQLDGDDCDDANQLVHPAAPEVCGDQIDNDCDGAADDDGFGAVTWYPDEDGDGFGADQATTSCVAPLGSLPSLAAGVDCDDANSAARPTATEACGDGVDNDCDGQTDEEGATAQTWLEDRDTDGYADPLPVTGCTPPDDALDDLGLGADCDDTDPDVNPGVEEVCGNDVDDDCDDQVDDDGLGAFTWYHDDDEDGYGDPTARTACDPPAGSLPNLASGADCDDNDPAAHPNAAEVWYDGRDQDCLGGDDFDQDHDGYQTDDIGGGDCNDLSALQNPGRPEICNNGFDDNCWDPEECNLGSGTLTSRAAATHTLTTGSLTDVVLGNFLGTPDLDLAIAPGNYVQIVDSAMSSSQLPRDASAVRDPSPQPNSAIYFITTSPDHDGDGFDDLFIPISDRKQLRMWAGPTIGRSGTIDNLTLFTSAPNPGFDGFPRQVLAGKFRSSNSVELLVRHLGLTVAVPDAALFLFARSAGPVAWDPYGFRIAVDTSLSPMVQAQDMNSDGLDDVLVGGNLPSGDFPVVSVMYAPLTNRATASSAPRIIGASGNNDFGCEVAAGRLGVAGGTRVVVASPPSHVYSYVTPTSVTSYQTFEIDLALPGTSPACPKLGTGDLNGDGIDDLVIARPNTTTTTNELRIYYGPLRANQSPIVLSHAQAIRNVRIGDIDDDGRAELIASSSSAVFVVRGRGI